MYPFNHSHRSFGWSLSLCSLLHIVGSFAKFQTGNGNEIVVVGILIDDKQPRDGRESSRIESSRIDSLVETEGSEELSPEETNCANETGRVISFSFSPFSFFVVAHQVSLNIARPLLEMQFEHARFLLLCPRNEKLALAWDISFVLEMQITTVKRTVRYESLARREEGKKRGDVDGKRRPVLSMLGSPKHPRARAFFSLSDAKIAPRSLHGRGLCRDCSGYNDRLIKKRFVAVNRGTRIYAALCTSYSSGLQSYAARELGKHVCQNASCPPSLSFSFFFTESTGEGSRDFAIGAGQN